MINSDINIRNIKVSFCGHTKGGKTNIFNNILDREFEESFNQTNGASYGFKNIIFDDKNYHVNLWDTSGQEKYLVLSQTFLRDANLVVLVYDPFERKSFTRLNDYNSLLKFNPVPNQCIILIIIFSKSCSCK